MTYPNLVTYEQEFTQSHGQSKTEDLTLPHTGPLRDLQAAFATKALVLALA